LPCLNRSGAADAFDIQASSSRRLQAGDIVVISPGVLHVYRSR
jgi:hypothetical protein